MPRLNIPKQNVLGLACEPPIYLRLSQEFLTYASQYIGRYYIGEKGQLPDPFIEHHGFMWYCPVPLVIAVKTSNIMSIIFSQKNHLYGHQYRHSMVDAILKTNYPIDIYGRGCVELNKPDNRIMGCFSESEPYNTYQFSIVIENCRLPDLFTEKLINSLIYECTPVYYGSTNIEKYLPGCTIHLTGNIGPDLDIISSILKTPEVFRKTIDRYDINRKISLLHHLHEIW
jgi:hypothetical protein